MKRHQYPVLVIVFPKMCLFVNEGIITLCSKSRRAKIVYFAFVVIRTTSHYLLLSCNCVILSTNKGGGSHKLQCYLVMDLNKHVWYLIHIERQRETITIFISAAVTDEAIENDENESCFSCFQTFWQLFLTFDIAG